MRRAVRTGCLWACLALTVTAFAQEGHPLVGSWHGDWAIGTGGRQDLTLIIDYTPDGKDVAGIVNPGYEHAALQNLSLTIPTPTDWSIRFEVELKSKAGKTTRYLAEGKLDKIGSDRRTLTGTWSAEGVKGDFKLTRDRDYSR